MDLAAGVIFAVGLAIGALLTWFGGAWWFSQQRGSTDAAERFERTMLALEAADRGPLKAIIPILQTAVAGQVRVELTALEVRESGA